MPGIDEKIAQFIADAELAHQVVHGDAETEVETENGPVKSLANAVGGLEEDATAAAAVATTKAGEADASATAAAGSATTAETQAGIATTKAGEADASATAAAGSATTAETQAGIATTKAGEASASAGVAAGHAEDLGDAVAAAAGYAGAAAAAAGGAGDAQTAAEGARDTALGAKDAAEAARDQAENAVGFAYLFDSATGAADPGAGEFRLNNGTLGSVTAAYVDNLDAHGNALGGWLDAFAASDNPAGKGYLTLRGVDSPTAFLVGLVGGVTDSGGYRSVALSVIASGGAFVAGERFLLSFSATGNKGTDGSGDMTGPASVTSGRVAVFDGPSGDLLAQAALTIAELLDRSNHQGTQAQSTITGLVAALAALAPLASPAFTGNPTAPTQSAGNNSTRLATTAFVQAAIAAIVGASPSTLDTLNELAAALGNDPNFATTITNLIAAKAPLASPSLTGNPTAPTPAATDSDTSIATTGFVYAVLALVEATAAQFRGNTAGKILTTDEVWAAAEEVALTDGATVAVNLSGGINFALTINGNRALGDPQNVKVGQSGYIRIVQGGGGGYALTLHADYTYDEDSGPPELATGGGQVTLWSYVGQAGGKVFLGPMGKNI